MRKVSEILQKKGYSTVTVSPDTPVIEALRVMDEKNIGSVVVTNEGSYAGILTERDYSRKVILKGKNSAETTVADIMSTDLPLLRPNDSIDHCMQLMSNKHIRYLPVFDNGNLAGIISMSDVVNATIANQKETISHLENYINSAV
ncbi:MAG: CBS domain-containing protein [Bacteroidota bacterium]